MQAALDSIVCHTPLNNLGFSRKGSALTFSVAFQALRTGLFEVGWGGAGLCEGLCRMSGWEESEAPHQPPWTEHQGQYSAAGAEGRWNFDATLAGQVGNLTGKAGWGPEAELEC